MKLRTWIFHSTPRKWKTISNRIERKTHPDTKVPTTSSPRKHPMESSQSSFDSNIIPSGERDARSAVEKSIWSNNRMHCRQSTLESFRTPCRVDGRFFCCVKSQFHRHCWVGMRILCIRPNWFLLSLSCRKFSTSISRRPEYSRTTPPSPVLSVPVHWHGNNSNLWRKISSRLRSIWMRVEYIKYRCATFCI